MRKRHIGLDVFRGWAIILMIIFHLCYDLNMFRFIHVDMMHDMFWVSFRALIVSMFLIAVGISLYLVHFPKIDTRNLKKRTITIGGAALLVSIASYVEFPTTWVYFGILHFILLVSFLSLPFLPYPYIALVTAVGIFVGYAAGILHTQWLYDMLKPFLHLPVYTRDLVTFFPWFGVVLIGSFLGATGWYKRFLSHPFFAENWWGNRLLALLGQHALVVYLLHLPLLFFVVKFVYNTIHR